MSMWEFLMCIEGWKLANGAGQSEKGSAPSEDEFLAMVEQYADQPVAWNDDD